MPSYRQVLPCPAASRFLMILLHYEQSRAAIFWLTNEVCVLGWRSVHLGNTSPEKKRRVRPLKPCAGTDVEGCLSPSGGQSLLKLEKDHDREETPTFHHYITIVPKDQAPSPIFLAGYQKGPSALYPGISGQCHRGAVARGIAGQGSKSSHSRGASECSVGTCRNNCRALYQGGRANGNPPDLLDYRHS